ncbi:uncharacterized protein LOC132193665 [Neocloeon triangulifer]|uniref:uncharacterized protein LOC132193665 n=1 Tax=Neocloeon triangulifer TaxID=2078957 RepID=UPI00286F497A|nr:uncharacterized protein LOC132193665 [Neocloeon triangulifer]
MLDFWTTIALVGAALALIYAYAVRNNDYWARRGIPFIKPVPFFGNMASTVFKTRSFADVFCENYMQLKPNGYGGMFEFMSPTLMVTSPELIRDMTVKNFDFFHDRRMIVSKDTDPLFARSLPGLKGDEWREMRNKLSPAFTASKLKGMFPHISKCAGQFAKFLVSREGAKTEPIEFKSTFTRMTNDVIATTAFGVETNAVQNPDEKFYKFAQIMTDFGALRSLIALGFMVFPKLMAAVGLSFTPKEVTNYFQQLIKGTMDFRQKKNISRPDMLQLLMAAQKGNLKKEADEDVGTIGEDSADSELHKKHMAAKKTDSIQITDEDIAAQAFIFFFAGYETVATLLAFAAHELAENPEVQEQLRDEIDAALSEGPLSYESVIGMKYLDMVVSESLRKYPPAVGTDRTCIKNYKVPGTDSIIEAGTTLSVPIYPLHRDPEYFPDPEKFDPERFSEENKANIKPYTYLPFGVGPHNCIGMRFALLEVKLCIIHLLATCNLRVCAKTEIPLKLSKKSFAMTTDHGFWLLAIPRENPTLKVKMLDCWTTIALVGASLALFYAYVVRNNDHWERRGIPFIKPVPFFGNTAAAVFKTHSFAELFYINYMKLKLSGFGGMFEFMNPTILVTSPELIRDIAVKNFDLFHDRRMVISTDTDPLFAGSLVGLKGDEWREMRNKLSPAFTASKLKGMFPHISKCAGQFAKFLVTREDAKTEPIEFKNTFTRMTNDVIATTAFGVETNAVQNPEEKFYTSAQTLTYFGGIRGLIALGFMVFPKLMKAIGQSFIPKEPSKYFQQLIKGTIEYRRNKNISRQDMLQLLIAAQKGNLKKEANEEVGTIGEDSADFELHKRHMAAKKNDSMQITDDDITAQAFIFFFAGFETVSTVLSFLTHELAVNPEIQDRLREEIDEALVKGPLCYESVMGMKYLDLVISETLRKHPPAVVTDRVCMKNYKVLGSDKIIEAGTVVSIGIYPLHRDPEYFPDPDKFDPERFNEENKAKIKPYTYLPFGVGPRNCIGMRFALLEVKLCVVHLLATCNLRVCSKTQIPLKLSKKSFAMDAERGFWLLAIPREKPTLKI